MYADSESGEKWLSNDICYCGVKDKKGI